ncbi:DUF2334 domain-containing protein [Bacillus sp. FJAT-49732]|uniref:DUF2334 domain-containing protein n=1 Tax=Lederbergia citrisecunda TaxID=2833583 RepID=A0A942THY6_9BACI|nr:polysaccharide deacetylase family protein [Lederbergia citrisecunda]MBS4198416.1 DUF2334 domain-containing protein [Lederbergia citrisecunda]
MIKKIGRSIEYLLKPYFKWRYWSTLYRNMVRQIDYFPSNKENNECIPYINKPGIAFSFDDSYRVYDWYKYGKDLFGYYDIKVTFNINGVNPLENYREHTQQEIDKLLELQAQGHEIAHHGFKHKTTTNYALKYGVDSWLKDEIDSLLHWMENHSHSTTNERFKKPVSFAFPHFVYNEEILKEIVPKYFKVARGHLYKDNLTNFNAVGYVPSICLDGYYSYSAYYLRKIIKLLKKTGKNLILTCHSILPEEHSGELYGVGKKASEWGTWRVSTRLIKTIIDEAKKNNLEFYTTSEIAGIATFIDHKMEEAVREHLSISSYKDIEIKELMKVKELDLSNKGISNLDGIEYFLNLEKLNLRNNELNDFRLLKKLPKLKNVSIDGQLSKKKKTFEGSLFTHLKGSCVILSLNMMAFGNSFSCI